MEIQHAARWTSTKQLKSYDMSNQEDALRRELEKRGLLPSSTGEMPTTRRCSFCNKLAGFGETLYRQCKRPLDRSAILKEQQEKENAITELRQELTTLKQQIELLRKEAMPGLMLDVLEELRRRNSKLPTAVAKNGFKRAQIQEDILVTA